MKLTLSKVPFNALAALAGLVLFTGSALAVAVSTGDLMLGFKASGGTGADKNLTVNLGPAANFYNAAPGTTVLSGLSVADIVGAYGNNWASRADLSWGVVGATGASSVGTAGPRTIWATRAEEVAGSPSIPWPRALQFTLQIPSNSILGLYNGAPGSFVNGSATPNSAVASVITSSLAGSWSEREAFQPGVSFSYFNPSVMGSMSGIAGHPSAYDGTSYGVLDLFDVRVGTPGDPAALLGAFGLNSSGQLVFSTNPAVFVPEPSAALTGLGALCALLLRRRR